MTDSLVAQLNRDGIHSLSAPSAFETSGSFVVVLENHGTPTHVHLRLDDSLSAVGHIEATNHFVGDGDRRRVNVELDSFDSQVTGTLTIAVGHGVETKAIDISIDPTRDTVRVDPDLATPSQREPTSPLANIDPLLVGAIASGVVAIACFVGAAFTSATVIFGIFGVLATLLAAGLLVLD